MISKTSHKVFVSLIVTIFLGLWAASLAGWTPEVRISEPGTSWYPEIAAQGDTLHVVYTNVAGGDKISYVRSTDGGLTWSEHQVLSDTVGTQLASFPRIVVSDHDIMALWKNGFIEGMRRINIGYSVSHNGGRTWTEPDYIFYPNWEHILYFAASGSDSVINIIFNSNINQELRFYNVRSTDFGESWSDTLELFRSAESGLMDMATYEDIFHCVWYGNFNGSRPWETYFIRSIDGGINWSDNIPLVPIDNHSSRWPSISADNSGNLAFCWTDFRYSPSGWTGDLFIKYSFDSGENWTEETQITFLHEDGYPDVFWDTDTVHVVWERGGQRSIFYLRSTDGGLTWGDEQRLDNDPSRSYWPRVAASNGKVYAIWADRRYDPDNDIYRGIYFSRYEEDTESVEYISKSGQVDWIKAYPNPFNSVTTLTYSNLKGGEIEILNISGQLIRTFHIDTGKEGKIIWDATDAQGDKISSGIYFARARGLNNTITKKLVYLK
jgi:hypothetical protein